MKEIQFKINGQNKTIKVTKDVITKIIGALFIIASAVLLGIFELYKMGWDTSLLNNKDFWIAYFVKLAMLYLAFFGAYIIKRSVNLKNPKILIPREILKHDKELISDNFQTTDCEKWLKNVYNYEKKLDIFKTRLQQKNSKLNIVEPTEPVANYKDLKNWFTKLFKPFGFVVFRIRKGIYAIKNWRYKRKLKKREFLEKQLALVDTHLDIIDLHRHRQYKEAKELYQTIERQDRFKFFMPYFKQLTFNRLFNVNIEKQGSDGDQFNYHEGAVIIDKVIKTVGFGSIFLAIITSITIDPIPFSLTKIIYIALNLLLMLWYVFNGVKTADRFVFGNVSNADSDRLKVCNKYRDDCILIGADWVKGFKTINQQEKETEQKPITNIEPPENLINK